MLLDTHLLLWAADSLERVPVGARALMADLENELLFSVVSIWEVAIKSGLNRPDFQVDARLLRRGLLDNGYVELPISGEHAVAVDALPSIHKDTFDRLLMAQATVEGFVLLTNDATLSRYPGSVRLV
nr:type II toxin-antitoxin system VapC family toxin [Acidithiobacillus ferrooxidans]